MIARHFPRDTNAVIFDLGCGYGGMIHCATLAGYSNVRGVDTAREQVEVATRLGIPGVAEGDIHSTLQALDEMSVDCVVAFDVIEHFSRDELVGLVDRSRRVLVPSGVWIIHTVNAESPFFGRARYGDLTHEVAFTSDSLSQLLHASGFRDVRCYEDEPVPTA